ncbi:MAG: GNAT family N-acetyltransferase [Bacteroidetes bacterium]|nr:MAG: GNAT family N-acetyltransferase [Bacteroidota bacterium]
MTEINIANSDSDYSIIKKLANTIWREYYIPILGLMQVEYMLNKYHTVSTITNRVEQGYKYFVITYEQTPVGFISIKKEKDSLFLSKIYVLKDYRGRKIGKTAMQFIYDKAKSMNCNKVVLTVNKHNSSSINAYEKLGFNNIGEIVIDIGNGFVMDDYKMEKRIEN